MFKRTRDRLAGFTLVELLVVIAIIALLIGILVPALSGVKDKSKVLKVQNLHKVLGEGCELYRSDMDAYPQSSGRNPFEKWAEPLAYLSGAQWLTLQLAGADLKGFVKKDSQHFYDSTVPAGKIVQDSPAEWLKWYSLTSDPNTAGLHRYGPYVPMDGDLTSRPLDLAGYAEGDALPSILLFRGTSEWSNALMPCFVDALGSPVLYYRANARATQPFTTTSDPVVTGRYDQRDNAGITASDVGDVDEGLDLGAGAVHPLGTLGWSAANPADEPTTGFAKAVYNPTIFGSQANGKVWPKNPDRFLLFSAGKDGLFGTPDDVTNF